jgi:hypothetical protein
MLAYQTNHLDHAEILLQAKKWHKNKLIPDQTYETIKMKYANPLYSPNFFVRIGLFVFTVISVIAANGLLMLITNIVNTQSDKEMAARFLFHGILMLGILEILINNKKLYKSGIDDALTYMSIGSILGGLCGLLYDYDRGDINSFILISAFCLPILIAATVRYSDMLLATAAFCCFILLYFLLITKTGEGSKYVLPFLIMIVSAGIYLITTKYKKIVKLRFWENSLWIVEILSLTLFYLAGNYYVVRTLSEELFQLQLMEGEDIPFAFIFYIFTAVIPLLYIFTGLKNKNKTLLNTGLILIAASVITFKYYFSLGHHEISFTVGGILMIAVAWLSIHYLKTPKFGITYTEDKDQNLLGNFDSEALIIAQTFSGPQHNQVENGNELGGGKFGGAGADGDY